MTFIAVSQNTITVTKGLHIDYYDNCNHTLIDVPVIKSEPFENDSISDVTISADAKYLAIITSTSKRLLVYDLPLSEKYKSFTLPRSASKIRFTVNNEQILVADKSGDALIYNIKEDHSGTKLLGHLSLLLDILHTSDGEYIITCDRDEKIRVSCYPNTYNIQTYCLGHKEFVNHIEMLPHNGEILTSTSGDGHVKCWNYVDGTLCYSIDTYLDVNDDHLKESFIKFMDAEGVEINTLPIIHYAVAQLGDNSSILAIAIHTLNKLVIYKLQTINNKISHKLIDKLTLLRMPAAIKIHNSSVYVYDDVDCIVSVFKISTEDQNVILKLDKKLSVFENKPIRSNVRSNEHDSVKVLYKRKFDNVQEYQERKKQRLEKSLQ